MPFLIDTGFSKVSFTRLLPGYAALVLHGVSSSALIHTRQVLTSSLGPTFTVAASTLGATVLALPIYLCRTVMVCPILGSSRSYHLMHSFIALISYFASPSNSVACCHPVLGLLTALSRSRVIVRRTSSTVWLKPLPPHFYHHCRIIPSFWSTGILAISFLVGYRCCGSVLLR